MAQARSSTDLYVTLGVPRDASADTIKQGYRRLAREAHPDANPDDPGAEERFKEISRAYSVLSDPDRRRSYDEFGDVALDPNFNAEAARRAHSAFGGGFSRSPGFDPRDAQGFSSLFEEFFGGIGGDPRRRAPRRGADLEATLELDFVKAALGDEHRLSVKRPSADGGLRTETLSVRIPPGVADGGRIRLAGKGAESTTGGPPGDLYATIKIAPHPVFRREDRDLHIEVPIGVSQAILGTEIEVPTLDGRAQVQVPAGTDGGSKLRLRAKGIPAGGGKSAGDLYVTLRIRVPKNLDEAARTAFEELAHLDPTDLRKP